MSSVSHTSSLLCLPFFPSHLSWIFLWHFAECIRSVTAFFKWLAADNLCQREIIYWAHSHERLFWFLSFWRESQDVFVHTVDVFSLHPHTVFDCPGNNFYILTRNAIPFLWMWKKAAIRALLSLQAISRHSDLNLKRCPELLKISCEPLSVFHQLQSCSLFRLVNLFMLGCFRLQLFSLCSVSFHFPPPRTWFFRHQHLNVFPICIFMLSYHRSNGLLH